MYKRRNMKPFVTSTTEITVGPTKLKSFATRQVLLDIRATSNVGAIMIALLNDGNYQWCYTTDLTSFECLQGLYVYINEQQSKSDMMDLVGHYLDPKCMKSEKDLKGLINYAKNRDN